MLGGCKKGASRTFLHMEQTGPPAPLVGLVQFETAEAAQFALQMFHGSDLRGSQLKIQIDARAAAGNRILVENLPEGCKDQELKAHCTVNGQAPLVSLQAQQTAARAGAALQHPTSQQGVMGGFAGGLTPAPPPPPVRRADSGAVMHQGLQQGCGAAVTTLATTGPQAGPQGCLGMILYRTPEQAQHAMAMLHNSPLRGSSLQVGLDGSDTSGCKLHIANLPQACDWRELRQHFSSAGEVYVAALYPTS